MNKLFTAIFIIILCITIGFTNAAFAGGGDVGGYSAPDSSSSYNNPPVSPTIPQYNQDNSGAGKVKVILEGSLRSKHERSNSSIIATVYEGDTFDYIQGSDYYDSRGVRWFCCVGYNGGTAWLSSQMAVVTDPNDYENNPSAYGLSNIYVTGGSVNVRTEPSLNSSIITTVHQNETYAFDGTVLDNRGVAFYHIMLHDGRSGYISTIYCYPY